MTEKEKLSWEYRFSGYPPPLISIGGNTDAGYWLKLETHPYYIHQPQSSTQPIFHNGPVRHFGTFDELPQDDPSLTTLYSQLLVTN